MTITYRQTSNGSFIILGTYSMTKGGFRDYRRCGRRAPVYFFEQRLPKKITPSICKRSTDISTGKDSNILRINNKSN